MQRVEDLSPSSPEEERLENVRKLLAFTRLYTTNETMVSEMGHVYRKLRECAPFQVRWCGVHHNISYIYILDSIINIYCVLRACICTLRVYT
jgi:hypothetical protein